MQINVFCALYLALYADENFFSDFAVPELHLVLYAGPYYTRVFTVIEKRKNILGLMSEDCSMWIRNVPNAHKNLKKKDISHMSDVDQITGKEFIYIKQES